MNLFIDNDVVHKLARLNLTSPAMRALAQSGGSLRVLGTARYKFHVDKPEKGRAKFGSRVHPRIVDFLSHCQRVDDEFDQGTHDRLSGVADIDGGEAMLLAASLLFPDSRLVTGDKRCLIALATDAACRDDVAALAGRVVCFEQAVLKTIEHIGFESLFSLVLPELDEIDDVALRVVFGSREKTTETSARAALRSYVEDLRKKTAGLLSP